MLAAALLVAWLAPQWPLRARAAAYVLMREQVRQRTVAGLTEHRLVAGPNVWVYYPSGEETAAQWVLTEAEAVYGRVRLELGFDIPRPVPVVLHANRRELQSTFGWGDHQSASGVYWAGVVRVVSPRTWLPGGTEAFQQQLYERWSPMAHELTHYALDYRTAGNYPRWFTEGLAQRVESRVTGFRLGSRRPQPTSGYTLAQLTRSFDSLPDQELAYLQSRRLVEYLYRTCTAAGVERLVAGLARSLPFWRSLQEACGLAPGDLERGWLQPAPGARGDGQRAGEAALVAEMPT